MVIFRGDAPERKPVRQDPSRAAESANGRVPVRVGESEAIPGWLEITQAVARASTADLVCALDKVAMFGLRFDVDLREVPSCPWCGKRGIQVLNGVQVSCALCGERRTRWDIERLVLSDTRAMEALMRLLEDPR